MNILDFGVKGQGHDKPNMV